MALLSGKKATELTQPEWLSSVYSSTPVIVFQSRTVLLLDPDTTCLSSYEKATELTQLE